MARLRRSDVPRPPRAALVAGLLLLVLVVTAILAYQAQDAARSHRAAAESVLQEYARLAEWEYHWRVRKAFQRDVVEPSLWAVLAADDSVAYPAWHLMRQGVAKAESKHVPASHFALDLASGRLSVFGRPMERHVREWLRDSLAARVAARDTTDTEHWGAFPTLDGCPHGVFFTVKGASAGRPAVYGVVVADLSYLAVLLRQEFATGPLIAPELSGGLPNDSLLALRVETLAGQQLFASTRQIDPALGVVDTVGGSLPDLAIRLSVREAAAEQLVIGGLPRSRLPLLLLLLVISAGLVAAAILQLRREYELARLRSQFVSSVSHELRTPLAQIRMFAETLLLGRVRSEEERRRSLEIVDQEARRLSHLVDNVLRFSRSERGMMRLDPRPVRAACLAREVCEAFAPLAATADARLRLEVEEDAEVRADPEALRQVLLNLLDNAVKYGPRGQTVRVGARVRNGRLRLSVDDEGPGIPPRDRERVWEAYARLDREGRTGVAGAGIGLAVVREIVGLHGGRAWVESAPGGGASFVLELPGARSVPGEEAGGTVEEVTAPVSAAPAETEREEVA